MVFKPGLTKTLNWKSKILQQLIKKYHKYLQSGISSTFCLRFFINLSFRDISNDHRLFFSFSLFSYCCVNKFKVRLISRKPHVYHSHWFTLELTPINHTQKRRIEIYYRFWSAVINEHENFFSSVHEKSQCGVKIYQWI